MHKAGLFLCSELIIPILLKRFRSSTGCDLLPDPEYENCWVKVVFTGQFHAELPCVAGT